MILQNAYTMRDETTVIVLDLKVFFFDKTLTLLKETHVRNAISPYIKKIDVLREGYDADELNNLIISSEVKSE